LKLSSKYNYGVFQDKPAEQAFGLGGKPIEGLHKTHALRIGFVVDPQGHCICMTGYIGGGQPSIYSYYTTVQSLKLDLQLQQIKLEECGRELLYRNKREMMEYINTSLGERAEE